MVVFCGTPDVAGMPVLLMTSSVVTLHVSDPNASVTVQLNESVVLFVTPPSNGVFRIVSGMVVSRTLTNVSCVPFAAS